MFETGVDIVIKYWLECELTTLLLCIEYNIIIAIIII